MTLGALQVLAVMMMMVVVVAIIFWNLSTITYRKPFQTFENFPSPHPNYNVPQSVKSENSRNNTQGRNNYIS
jgi:hypothetical protein